MDLVMSTIVLVSFFLLVPEEAISKREKSNRGCSRKTDGAIELNYFNQSFTLNLNDWKSGTYNVILISKDKIVEFKKVDVIR